MIDVKDDTTPKGYKCECGTEHKFPVYVYAHWREELVHACETCGNKHTIFMGRATLVPERTKKTRKKAA